MKHVTQKQGLGTCGAVAYASILGVSELQGIRECSTVMKGRRAGTRSLDVQAALQSRGINSYQISIERAKIKDLFWLAPLSTHFPLYVSTSERKNGCHHAVAIANELVYDGHNTEPQPLELYLDTFVESLIVVDMELETYVQ